VLGRRQIAAEDDRVRALGDQGPQRVDERGQLGIGLIQKLFGASHERKKRRIGVKDRARLEIDGVLVVAVFVVDLRLEAVDLVGDAVA